MEIKKDNLIKVESFLKMNNIFYEIIGCTQSKYFELKNELKLDVSELYGLNNKWYHNY